MIKRVLAIAEIKKRIKDNRNTLVSGGIKSFHENLQRGLVLADLPAVCLSEGPDEILKRTARNPRGLPMDRMVEIIIDTVLVKAVGTDIRKVCIDIREVVLSTIHPVTINSVVDNTTFLSELRIEGPFGYGLPDVEGIRLVLGLNYVDKGSY